MTLHFGRTYGYLGLRVCMSLSIRGFRELVTAFITSFLLTKELYCNFKVKNEQHTAFRTYYSRATCHCELYQHLSGSLGLFDADTCVIRVVKVLILACLHCADGGSNLLLSLPVKKINKIRPKDKGNTFTRKAISTKLCVLLNNMCNYARIS